MKCKERKQREKRNKVMKRNGKGRSPERKPSETWEQMNISEINEYNDMKIREKISIMKWTLQKQMNIMKWK